METRFAGSAFSLGTVLLVLFLSLVAVSAQNYSIPAFTIDNGGGTSTGGVYRITGTIGQPDASSQLSGGQPEAMPSLNIAFANPERTAVAVSWNLQGGNYTLNGGFWRTPASPFVLIQNNDVNQTVWTPVPSAPISTGTNNVVVVPSVAGNMFYRLKRND